MGAIHCLRFPAAQERDVDLVDDRRPEELERISEPDQREDAHRLEVDLGLGEPGVERPEEERERQAGRESEQSHEARFRVAQRAEKRAPAWFLRFRD
jgi:hypothetical protein